MNDEIYTPDHLNLWTMPECYFGDTWCGFYVFLMQTRDSDCLERSNFQCALEAIGGKNYGAGVYVVRESHWACGWVEWIAIHSDNEIALLKADEICEALQRYPVVNECHFGELEREFADKIWSQTDARERLDIMRHCSHDFLSFGDMLRAVREDSQTLPGGLYENEIVSYYGG